MFTNMLFLKISQNSHKSNCLGILFLVKVANTRPATLSKNEIPTPVFSCEFCGIFKSTFFREYFQPTASQTRICFLIQCVKSVQIRSYFWSVIPCIRNQSEYRKIRTRNNSVFGNLSHSDTYWGDCHKLQM